MNTLDYSTLVVFSLLIFGSGMAFYRSGSSVKSFFAAGGSVPYWLSGLSLFMSFFSAGTFVVWGSIAYDHGWVAITIQWMMGLSGFVIAYFIAPRWKRLNIITVAEFLTNKYGHGARKFYSYIFLVLSITYTGAFLYPVAKLINVATPLTIESSIILLGCIIVAYTAVGGLWAVIITDVLQFVILSAGIIILVVLTFQKIETFTFFEKNTPKDFFDLLNGEYSLLFMIAFALYNTAFIGGNWAYVQRYTSVRSEKSARNVGILFGVLYLISPVLWMIPPMAYRAMNSSLSGLENEGAYLLICKEVLPSGVLGLMLGGMIFATASSVNTTLNTSAAVFTNDVFVKLYQKCSDIQLIKVGRIATIVFGILTIIFALFVDNIGGIVEVVLSIGAITGVPLYGPPIWALFSKRQTMFSLVAATVLGLSMGIFFKFITPLTFDFTLTRAEEMFVGVIVPLLVLAYFEWIHKGASYDLPDQVMTTKAVVTPTIEDNNQNVFAIKVVSITITIIGAIITGLGILAEFGDTITIIVGVCTVLLGICIQKYAKY